MKKENIFLNLKFDDFKKMSKDKNLSIYEKIGFPDNYREGKEHLIFNDIKSKITLLSRKNKMVLDIGPGCSELPNMIIDLCKEKNHKAYIIDSEEMLSNIKDRDFLCKINAFYPNCSDFMKKFQGKFDIIICYSVFHYIYPDVSIDDFLDSSLSLLAPGGQFLIGDIPNISKRKRFFSSQAGIEFHKDFMKTDKMPVIEYDKIDSNQINDDTIYYMLERSRKKGFDAYVMPQNNSLPMANRREDIFISRP